MRSELSLSDDWETPQELFDSLCYKYGIFPKLDVACNQKNNKCRFGLSFSKSALDQDWAFHDLDFDGLCDVWCNPPHSLTEEFVRHATKQWAKYNINIMMIIPANSICTRYGEECIEPHAEYHPIFERPKFKMNGEEKDSARNSYFVVIWRKK